MRQNLFILTCLAALLPVSGLHAQEGSQYGTPAEQYIYYLDAANADLDRFLAKADEGDQREACYALRNLQQHGRLGGNAADEVIDQIKADDSLDEQTRADELAQMYEMRDAMRNAAGDATEKARDFCFNID